MFFDGSNASVLSQYSLYRPFYLQLTAFPVLNYCVPKPYSPFEVDKKLTSGQKQTQSKQRFVKNSLLIEREIGLK